MNLSLQLFAPTIITSKISENDLVETDKEEKPILFIRYPIIEERMTAYCINYCSISVEDMKIYILLGEELERKISQADGYNNFETQLSPDANPQAAVSLMWLLMAKAASYDDYDVCNKQLKYGKAYINGAFRIEDSHHKLERFLKLCAGNALYTRISTHMKEYLKNGEQSFGFDLKNQGLPAKHHTILFIRLHEDSFKYIDTLYIKLEKYGYPPLFKNPSTFLPNLLEQIAHTKEYLFPQCTEATIKPDRKEHPKKKIQEEFKHIITILCQEKGTYYQKISRLFYQIYGSSTKEEELSRVLTRFSQKASKRGCKHGISEMRDILDDEILKKLEVSARITEKQIQKRQNMIDKLDKILERAKPEGYQGKIKGYEVALPSLGYE